MTTARGLTPEASYAVWWDLMSPGVHAFQAGLIEQEAATTTQRGFMPATIAGLLQTPEYARRVFEQLAATTDTPATVDEAVRLRMRRQEVLHAPGKSFHIVLTEAALRYGLAPPEVMRAQLDRLVEASRLPSVRLGVIPFGNMPPGAIPLHGFWIDNDSFVRIETFAAHLRVSDSDETAVYTRVFDQMAAVALYDDKARELISRIAAQNSG